jgi:endonuclease YncB( thermonuclease family)
MSSQRSHPRLRQVSVGLALGVLGATALFAGTAGSAVAASANGTVSRVVDGDTLQVRSAGRARTVDLLGVDAPELRGSVTRRCHGAAAKRALSRLLPEGAAVRLTTDAKGTRAGRYVYRGRRLINLSLLRAGNARAAGATDLKLKPRLLTAERAAQKSERGLWRDCAPGAQPPPPAQPPAGAGPLSGEDARRRAQGDLGGRVFIRLNATTFSSSESHLHMCSDGRYIEDVSTFSDLSGTFTARTEGFWEVLTAEYTATSGAARVRLRNPDGTEGFSDFLAQGSAVFVNNTQVTVNRSDLCP